VPVVTLADRSLPSEGSTAETRSRRVLGQALAWKVTERNPDEYGIRDPAGHDPGLYFMKVPEPKAGKNRLHLDVLTAGPLEDEVARLVEAGAVLVEARQDPASFANPDTWTVLRDPEGNEFCVTSTATLTGWD
jgi:Glyoxalase-like domain